MWAFTQATYDMFEPSQFACFGTVSRYRFQGRDFANRSMARKCTLAVVAVQSCSEASCEHTMLSEGLARPRACVFFRAMLAWAYDCRETIFQQGRLTFAKAVGFLFFAGELQTISCRKPLIGICSHRDALFSFRSCYLSSRAFLRRKKMDL